MTRICFEVPLVFLCIEMEPGLQSSCPLLVGATLVDCQNSVNDTFAKELPTLFLSGFGRISSPADFSIGFWDVWNGPFHLKKRIQRETINDSSASYGFRVRNLAVLQDLVLFGSIDRVPL